MKRCAASTYQRRKIFTLIMFQGTFNNELFLFISQLIVKTPEARQTGHDWEITIIMEVKLRLSVGRVSHWLAIQLLFVKKVTGVTPFLSAKVTLFLRSYFIFPFAYLSIYLFIFCYIFIYLFFIYTFIHSFTHLSTCTLDRHVHVAGILTFLCWRFGIRYIVKKK